MQPTLSEGEYLLFDRLGFSRRPLRKGEIVLAYHPMDRRFLLIKRVLAVPGEEVVARDGDILVNGRPWTPPAALPGPIPVPEEFSHVLGPDEYFLMGDNPSRSTDSRQLGPFSVHQIKARAWLVYWPLSRWRILHIEDV
jgi:signal peptidase I